MATTTNLTLDEFLALPETKPGNEYIDGEVVHRTMPTWAHGVVERLLSFVFTVYLRAHGVGDAGSEIRCIFGPEGSEHIYMPDFVFVRTGRLQPLFGPFRGPPDLAVEILSPDDAMTRVMENARFYLLHGVRLVWIIDPQVRTATVMTSPNEARILSDDDAIDGGDVLPDFRCFVHELLPPTDVSPH